MEEIEYACENCDHSFELNELRVNAVRCPECLKVAAYADDRYFPEDAWDWEYEDDYDAEEDESYDRELIEQFHYYD